MEQNVGCEKPILFAIDTVLEGHPIMFIVLNSMYELPSFLFLLFIIIKTCIASLASLME